MKKYTIAVIIGLALFLQMGQFATAQVSKEELKSISTPDKVKTSLGELKFFDEAAHGQRGQLARNHTGKELVHHPADVWPARALDQQDLAPE